MFELYGWENVSIGYKSPMCFLTKAEYIEAFKNKYGKVEKPIIMTKHVYLPSNAEIIRMGYLFVIRSYDVTCGFWEFYEGPTESSINEYIDEVYDKLDLDKIKLFCCHTMAIVKLDIDFEDISNKPDKKLLKQQFIDIVDLPEDFFTIFLKCWDMNDYRNGHVSMDC